MSERDHESSTVRKPWPTGVVTSWQKKKNIRGEKNNRNLLGNGGGSNWLRGSRSALGFRQT